MSKTFKRMIVFTIFIMFITFGYFVRYTKVITINDEQFQIKKNLFQTSQDVFDEDVERWIPSLEFTENHIEKITSLFDPMIEKLDSLSTSDIEGFELYMEEFFLKGDQLGFSLESINDFRDEFNFCIYEKKLNKSNAELSEVELISISTKLNELRIRLINKMQVNRTSMISIVSIVSENKW